jgi:hypothetical protein
MYKIYSFKKECLINNRKVIAACAAIIIIRKIRISTTGYTINPKGVEFLRLIIEKIQFINGNIETLIPGENPPTEQTSRNEMMTNILNNFGFSFTGDFSVFDELLILVKNRMFVMRANMLFSNSDNDIFVVNKKCNSLFPKEIIQYFPDIDIIRGRGLFWSQISSLNYSSSDTSVIENYNYQTSRNLASTSRAARAASRSASPTSGSPMIGGGLSEYDNIPGDTVSAESMAKIFNNNNLLEDNYTANFCDILFTKKLEIGLIDDDDIWDFYFTILPYFSFLGETCFDIGILSQLNKVVQVDVQSQESPSFTDVIALYVANVLKPRELYMVNKEYPELPVDTDQRLYLRDFGIYTQDYLKEIYFENISAFSQSGQTEVPIEEEINYYSAFPPPIERQTSYDRNFPPLPKKSIKVTRSIKSKNPKNPTNPNIQVLKSGDWYDKYRNLLGKRSSNPRMDFSIGGRKKNRKTRKKRKNKTVKKNKRDKLKNNKNISKKKIEVS